MKLYFIHNHKSHKIAGFRRGCYLGLLFLSSHPRSPLHIRTFSQFLSTALLNCFKDKKIVFPFLPFLPSKLHFTTIQHFPKVRNQQIQCLPPPNKGIWESRVYGYLWLVKFVNLVLKFFCCCCFWCLFLSHNLRPLMDFFCCCCRGKLNNTEFI